MTGGGNGTGMRILMIEDDAFDVELMIEACRDAGLDCDLDSVGDGLEALDFLRRKPPFESVSRPNLILLDLNMPRMDGREFLAEIKGDGKLCGIPVIVFTTSQSETDVNNCYRLGANCYISKPVSYEDLRRIVEAIESFWFNVARFPSNEGAPAGGTR